MRASSNKSNFCYFLLCTNFEKIGVRFVTPGRELKFSHHSCLHTVTFPRQVIHASPLNTIPVTRDIIYGWLFKCTLAKTLLVCGMKYYLP